MERLSKSYSVFSKRLYILNIYIPYIKCNIPKKTIARRICMIIGEKIQTRREFFLHCSSKLVRACVTVKLRFRI